MPELKEDEWEKILNNISIISFLQGLNIGGKVYNGYSIITNTKNEEVVAEDAIYITYEGSKYYYKPIDTTLSTITSNKMIGIFNIDFERKKRTIDGIAYYYYPNNQLGSYSSIISQTSVYDLSGQGGFNNIYDYMQSLSSSNYNLAQAYFTALGRERYSMYKTNNNASELISKFLVQ